MLTVTLGLAASDASTLKRLVVGEGSENTEHDRSSSVKLDTHEAVGDGVRDVLKVHGRALDQDTNGDDGVKLASGSRLGARVGRGGSARARGVVDERQQVGRRDERGLSLGALRLAASNKPGIVNDTSRIVEGLL